MCASQSICAAESHSAPISSRDEFTYLEEIHGERALAWVKRQNQRTLSELEGDPRFEGYKEAALAIEKAKIAGAPPKELKWSNFLMGGDSAAGKKSAARKATSMRGALAKNAAEKHAAKEAGKKRASKKSTM